MPRQFASSKPIGEVASLLLLGAALLLSLLIFLDWLPVIYSKIGWTSRPYPPSVAELKWASCHESIHMRLLLLLPTIALAARLAWLRWGRQKGWLRAAGRTFVDLVLSAFLCEILLLQANLQPIQKPIAAAFARQCESLRPRPAPPPVPDVQNINPPQRRPNPVVNAERAMR